MKITFTMKLDDARLSEQDTPLYLASQLLEFIALRLKTRVVEGESVIPDFYGVGIPTGHTLSITGVEK